MTQTFPKSGIPKTGISKAGIPKLGIPKTVRFRAPLVQTPLRLPLILTVCKLAGALQKARLFSEERLFCRNSTRKPSNLKNHRFFTKTPCKSSFLYNAPSVHTVEMIFGTLGEFCALDISGKERLFARVLRGNTIRGNTTRNSERKMAL